MNPIRTTLRRRNLPRPLRHAGIAAAAPAGTTLTEVLISLLVMGIGIVSLASLFPISVLRSVQATQLTNAVFLAQNARAMVQTDSTILQEIRNVPGDTLGIVDPLGYHLMPADLQTRFGNSDASTPHTIVRYSAGRGDDVEADFLVTLPDSWIDVGQGTATGPFSATSVTISSVDLTNVTAGLTRVVLFDSEGRKSQVRWLNAAPTGSTVTWNEDLPSSFNNVGIVRVQTQERRYTWMLTVRKKSGVCNVDVVVFFRRPFATADERIYGWPTGENLFKLKSNIVTIPHPAGAPPYLKKGGYVFDATNSANNGHWYKIQDVTPHPDGTQTTLTLERPAVANGNRALFMRGIVEVYPLKDVL